MRAEGGRGDGRVRSPLKWAAAGALVACAPAVTTGVRAPSVRVVAADASHATDAASPTRAMVTRRGVCLFRDGARLRLVGSSAFHLHEESVRAGLGWQPSRTTIQAVRHRATQRRARAQGRGVQREAPRRATIQRALGVLREENLVALDRVIAEAHARDVLLVVVLSNYWDDYGGLPRYLQVWLGLPSDYDHRALSMRDARVRAALAAYMRAIVTRRNTITGRLYRDEPTILHVGAHERAARDQPARPRTHVRGVRPRASRSR